MRPSRIPRAPVAPAAPVVPPALGVLLVALAVAAAPPLLGAQRLAPPSTGGFAALERALERLAQNRRVLVIGAHPDDEDTELLALLARGMGAEAAYLSLSRGEGGQNLIGPELGPALGLLRSQELLAARAVDGARQYFTRAFDFGYSRSLEETLRFWPRDSLLVDVVRIVRRFRPQVIVSVFSGTPRDGHGHHQAAALLAREAFAAAGDSARFESLAREEGLRPWRAFKLYRSTRFDTAQTTLSLESGLLDPFAGQSYHQLAMASRSLHRSQDMGRIQEIGPSRVRLALVEDRTGTVSGLFAGIDTGLPPGLERYRALIDSARALLSPRDPGRIVPLLAAALAELRRVAALLDRELRAEKERVLEEALATAAGVLLDATADDDRVAPGEQLVVTASVWNAGAGVGAAADGSVAVESLLVGAPPTWRVEPEGAAANAIAPGAVARLRFLVRAPDGAEPTQPYFLLRPLAGALYDWSDAPPGVRGEPFEPPPLVARARLRIAGVPVTLTREVAYRYNDEALGEIRRPIAVASAVDVRVEPEVLVWPTGSRGPRALTVTLVLGARGRVEGDVRLVPAPGGAGGAGWPEVAPQRFALEGEGSRQTLVFALRSPASLPPGDYEIRAEAEAIVPAGTAVGSAARRRRFDHAAEVVEHPHIRPVAWQRRATVSVRAAPLVLPRLSRVGYVRGASDRVPEALAALGLPIHVLGAEALVSGDLSRYDAIVVGSRAYETDAALVAANRRLLDYVRGGGLLIVQYQQYAFVRGTGRAAAGGGAARGPGGAAGGGGAGGAGYAPYPLTIAVPHDRVADETAPVRALEPTHPVFRFPNPIGPADWDAWLQERGLYFARTWDPAYRPLLEMADPGEPPQRGGLLVARLGRGTYVYTGLSFFRQVPAGVPGATRLFVNLLALACRPTATAACPR